MDWASVRRFKPIQDQENVHAIKAKSNALPVKRQVRGALGEINSNVQIQREVGSKGALEKKPILKNTTLKSNYSNVQSKIDTGLSIKTAATTRPPLRREESTAAHAARAAKAKLLVKKNAVINETAEKKVEVKKSSKVVSQKPSVEKPVSQKPVATKEDSKEEPVSLEKLRLEPEPVEDKDLPPLPADIEDIDEKDQNSPLLMSTYIKDIYNYLQELEDKYPINENHLQHQDVITGKMRGTLIDWLVEVQNQFTLLLETLHLSIGIIDRYLQKVTNVQRNQLQLIGVTAMFIASKYEEVYAPDVADFVYITNQAYTKADVFQCEQQILSKLGFSLGRPIPLHFLRRFVKAAQGTSINHHLAKYFVDLSLVHYGMAHYKPSELAAAAMCLSLHLLSGKSVQDTWTLTLVYYSGYSLKHIKPIMAKIAQLVLSIEMSKYKAVFKKYASSSLAKVSLLPQLSGPLIKKIAEQ